MSIEDNKDDPKRHNIGGAMNRPPRNLDPESPRNKKHARHPLINPDSTHYDDDDGDSGGITFIEQFESDHTVREVFTWAVITIEKYMYRQNKKGQKVTDTQKIADYTAYLDVLIMLSQEGYRDMIVTRAYQKEGIKWSYKH